MGKNAIDGIDELDEFGSFAIAGLRNIDREIGVNVSGVATENNDAICEDHGFFNVMRDNEDGARGNLVAKPKFQKLAPQGFGGENVKRGEGFVHEKDFRLNDESPRNADTLLHAARKFFRISGLKAIQPDCIDDAQSALVAFYSYHAARLERSLDVFKDREPGEKSKTLEDDGDVGRFVADGLAVPVNRAGAGGREAGHHAKQRGFTAAGRAE